MSWIAHDGAQEEFLQRTEFEVLFGGMAGPGKTAALIAAVTRDIPNGRYHGLILRRTYPQLGEIIDRCYELYPGMGGVYTSGNKRWSFPSGAKIDLGHMQHENDKYNYHGHEYHRVCFDELTMFTETQYTYMFSRVRTIDPDIVCQVLSASNPGQIGNQWVKERFQPGDRDGKTYYDKRTGLSRIFIPATREDNPTLFLTDPDYVSRLEGLSELERKRQLLGIWDSFENQVFTELSKTIHGYEDFDIDPEWERICVFDWGFASPFSVGWYAVDYDGCLWRYREWYGCRREETGEDQGADEGLKLQAWEVAKGILERENGEKIRHRIADPSIWHPRPHSRRSEARGPTIEEDFSNEGVYFQKADNDRMHGKMQVHKRLKPELAVDEETGEILSEIPMLKVANSCKGFWRTMPALYADQKDADEVDTNQEDHVYDEVRYACMSRPLRPKKVVGIQPGTMRYEIEKLKRAKRRAKRLGISVAEAYRRK